MERTFAWISKRRRCVPDYETKPDHHEAMIYIAMIMNMSSPTRPHRRLVTRVSGRSLSGAQDEDLVGAAGRPGHDLGGVAWGRSLGCRPI
jgi:hypothetical protein